MLRFSTVTIEERRNPEKGSRLQTLFALACDRPPGLSLPAVRLSRQNFTASESWSFLGSAAEVTAP
jgi:hypothetical protein